MSHSSVPPWLSTIIIVLALGVLGRIATILNEIVKYQKPFSIFYLLSNSIISGFVVIMVWFLMGTPAREHDDILQGWQMFVIGMAGGGGSKVLEAGVEGVLVIINTWINNLKSKK